MELIERLGYGVSCLLLMVFFIITCLWIWATPKYPGDKRK